jgi:polar amino acid transport system substrate-binding protein
MASPVHRLLALAACTLILATAPAAAAAPLIVGSDVSHPPLEFFQGKTMVGVDIDLLNAIAGKMHQAIAIQNHAFGDLVPGVQSGKFSLAAAGIFDTRKRETTVDFVDYMLAGSGLLIPAGNPKHIFALDNLCGLTVALEKGTLQETEAKTQSDSCGAIHLGPIKVDSYPTDTAALTAFRAGKADVMIDDFPIVAYNAKALDGGKKWEVAGPQFKPIVYGIAVSKKNPGLRDAVRAAILALVADGTYDKILARWGLTKSALRTAPINAGRLYER